MRIDSDARAPLNTPLSLEVPLRSGAITATSMAEQALLCVYEAVPQDSPIWAHLTASHQLLVDPASALGLSSGSACAHRWADRLLVRSVVTGLSSSSGLQLDTDQHGLAFDLQLAPGALFPSTPGDVRTYALGSDPLLPGDSSSRLLPCQTAFVGPPPTACNHTQAGDDDKTTVRVTVVLTGGGQLNAGSSDATSWFVLLAWLLQVDLARFAPAQGTTQGQSVGLQRFSWLILEDRGGPPCSPSPRQIAARLQWMMDFACVSVSSPPAAPASSLSSANPWMLSQLHRSWNCAVPLEIEANDPQQLSNSGSVFTVRVALPIACWLLLCFLASCTRLMAPVRIRWWRGVCCAYTGALFQSAVFGTLLSSSLQGESTVAQSTRPLTCLLSLWALHASGNLWAVAVNLQQQRHNMLLRTWLLKPASKIALGCCCVLAILVHPAALCLLHSRWISRGGFDAPILRTLYPFRALAAFPRLNWSSWTVFLLHHTFPWTTLFVAIWLFVASSALVVQQWSLLLLLTSGSQAMIQAASLSWHLFDIVDTELDSQHQREHSDVHSDRRGALDDGAHDVELAELEAQEQQHANAASLSDLTLDLQPPADVAVLRSAALSPVPVPVPRLVVHFDPADPPPMSPNSPPAAPALELHHRRSACAHQP